MHLFNKHTEHLVEKSFIIFLRKYATKTIKARFTCAYEQPYVTLSYS